MDQLLIRAPVKGAAVKPATAADASVAWLQVLLAMAWAFAGWGASFEGCHVQSGSGEGSADRSGTVSE